MLRPPQVQAALERILHNVGPVPPPRKLPKRPAAVESDNEAFDRGNSEASPPLYYDEGRYAELAGVYAEALEQIKVASQPPPEDPNAKKKGETASSCAVSLMIAM